MTVKLAHLRDVLAVAETGSLRAAGRQLGITQPAITRSIREIEHELGVPLFERHAKGVKVTPIGASFLRRAEAIQSELRRAREEIEQLKGHQTGQVTVAFSSGSAIAILPGALPTFRKRFPDAMVKIMESLFQSVEAEIISGSVDFYVGPLDDVISSTTLLVDKLFDNRRMVIARRGHPLQGARTLAELSGAKWIRPAFTTRKSEADFELVFERAGLPQPQVVMHTRSALMTLLAMTSSDLLTILPTQLLDFPAAMDRLQPLTLEEELYAAPICRIRRRDLPLTPMAEHLFDLIQKSAENYERTHRTAAMRGPRLINLRD